MVNFFLRIYDFLHARRWLCYGGLAAVVALLLVMVSTLRYNEDIYDFLPMDEKQQKALTLYQDISGGQRIVAMVSYNEEGSDAAFTLEEAVDTFVQQLQRHDGMRHIAGITWQVDFEKLDSLTAFAYHNAPFMLSDADYARMERTLASPDSIDKQLSHDVEQMMYLPGGAPFTPDIATDPLGLFTPMLSRLQTRQGSLPFYTDNGYIYTSDGRYALVMITSRYGSMESANNKLLVHYVDSVAGQTMKAMPEIRVETTGSPVIAVDNATQIKTDSLLAVGIAVVLILALLVWSFRSARSLTLIGVSILFGWLFALAFMALFRSNVSLIVLGIGSIIIGIAVNYPLHFVAHIAHGGSIREVLRDMVSPLLIGNITTVGAFASLIPLDAPALRDLGLFAAFMLIGTILFVLVFLPHLVRPRAAGQKERLLFGRLSSMTPRRNGWVLGTIAVLTLVFGYFSLGTSFDANLHNINYLTPTQERLLADLHFSDDVRDTASIYVVSEGRTWDEALARRSRLAPTLDSLKASGAIVASTDVTAVVGSTQMQTERLKRWNAFWDEHRDETLALLRREAPNYGFSDDAFDSFAELIGGTYEPHAFDYYEPLVSTLFAQSFSQSTGRCAVVDRVNAASGAVERVEQTLNQTVGDDGFAFDFAGMNSAVANSLSDNFNYIGLASGVIVFLFLWLSFRRLDLSILAFLPMAIGWLWILGIMNLLGMQFNIVNVILATFIFGQGDDYTIFMTEGLIAEHTYGRKLLPSYKNSILISALIMFIGIGSLIVARHPALHSLAEVTIVGMLTVVVMAWIVPPIIFNWLVRRRATAKPSRPTTT